MTIGITGSTGFVGSHFVRHFSSLGHEVIAYGSKPNPPVELLKFAHYQQWDITQKIPKGEYNLDVLIHCAGSVNLSASYNEIKKVNVEGTRKVLQFARGANHFIYISTASVYNSFSGKNNAQEDDLYHQRYSNNYARTKAEAEQLIKTSSSGFKKITILRPHFIYGPGDRSLIPRVLGAIRGKYFFIFGEGTNKYSITHIGNLCYGLSLVLQSNKQGFNIYNISDEVPVTTEYIFSKLFNVLGMKIKIIHFPYLLAQPLGFIGEKLHQFKKSTKPPLLTRDIVRQLTQESTISLQMIKRDLNYNPPYSYEEGLQDLNSWIKSIGGVKSYLEAVAECSWLGELPIY